MAFFAPNLFITKVTKGITITIPIPLSNNTYPKVTGVREEMSRIAGMREAQVAKAAPRIKKAAQVAISCCLGDISAGKLLEGLICMNSVSGMCGQK